MTDDLLEIRDELLIKDYRPYVLWRRVSTKKQGDSGLGLEAQLELARSFTRKEPEEVFTDVYTGTKLKECQELWKAIALCKRNGWLLVVAKTDRFRNAKEALEVIDVIGERNISFCDLPNVDRMILTIMFSVWERQAYMGRINTKLALAERKRQAKQNGGWISKNGRWCKALGGREYMSKDSFKKFRSAGEESHGRIKRDWCEKSTGFKWVAIQFHKGITQKEILEEFNRYHDMGMSGFCSFTGKALTPTTLGRWIKLIRKIDKENESTDSV